MKKFIFFEGIVEDTFVFNNLNTVNYRGGVRRLRVAWNREMGEDLVQYHGIDAEAELTRIMSEEIARGIDEDVIRTITRRINGGDNHGIDYLNHWLRIGDNRA
jgi:predicted chitinase